MTASHDTHWKIAALIDEWHAARADLARHMRDHSAPQGWHPPGTPARAAQDRARAAEYAALNRAEIRTRQRLGRACRRVGHGMIPTSRGLWVVASGR